MRVAVIGLGLIGGSIAKAARQVEEYCVRGFDRDEETLAAALGDRAIAAVADETYLRSADLVIVALPPVAASDWIVEHADLFRAGAVVSDIAGVKRYVHDRVYGVLKALGVVYLGAHPMAGKEVSGYRNSDANLFCGASLILTPTEAFQSGAVESMRKFAKNLGFGSVTVTDPDRHDRVVAYTSELAHVVSSAYMKSPTAEDRVGYSAGSYQDMTRVATLDESLWSELMILNRESLLKETDTLIANLSEYRDALLAGNRTRLCGLLKDGKQLKLADIERNRKK